MTAYLGCIQCHTNDIECTEDQLLNFYFSKPISQPSSSNLWIFDYRSPYYGYGSPYYGGGQYASRSGQYGSRSGQYGSRSDQYGSYSGGGCCCNGGSDNALRIGGAILACLAIQTCRDQIQNIINALNGTGRRRRRRRRRSVGEDDETTNGKVIAWHCMAKMLLIRMLVVIALLACLPSCFISCYAI